MNKKIWTTGLLVLTVLASAGCVSKQTAAPAAPSQGTQTEQNSTAEIPDTDSTDKPTQPDSGTTGNTPALAGTENTAAKTKDKSSENKQTSQITVYYTDAQQMELKEAKKEITYPSELQKYKEAFESLQKSGDTKLVPLWAASIEVHQIKYDNGALSFDISLPQEAHLGSGGEEMALDALKKTMFQFKEVKSLDLLVDGQSVESLMGHVDLDHPMKR